MTSHLRTLAPLAVVALLLVVSAVGCGSDGFTPPPSLCPTLNLNVAGAVGYPRNPDGSYMEAEQQSFENGCLDEPVVAGAAAK